MDFPVSPRIVAHTTRTSALTNNDCPGLTEIKNVRIRNNLLEEIFNVEDSIELDYFELERQEANFDSCLTGYNSPSQTRLSLDLKQEERFTAENNGYQLHELQSRRTDSVANVNQTRSIGVCVTRSSTAQELVSVASPTISSTCEGVVAGPVAAGVGSISSDSPSATAASVHSTTNASGTDSITSTDEKTAADKVQLGSVGEGPPLQADTERLQAYGMRANVRPRPESRTHNMSQQAGCLSPAADISVPVSSSGGLRPLGDSTTASSSSTSPSQLHVTKRQRVIDCGSDLLAEVREAYEYVQGADLYAPSTHPTFTDLDVARFPATFQPHTDQHGQPPMNFNFTGQAGSVPVAFVGNSRIGGRQTASTVMQAGMSYIGGRRTASPSVVYQSCPDVASPGYHQGGETVAYSRFSSQRAVAAELATTASLSAPTTPSKRTGHWSADGQHMRSTMSPSLQAQGSWRPDVPLPRECSMPVQLSRQNVMTNNRQNISAHVYDYEYSCEPCVQDVGAISRPQSPLAAPGHGSAIFYNDVQSRSHYTPSVLNPVSGNTHRAPAPGSHFNVPDAVEMGEGAPLFQNAFLRSVVDDESLVFRSHPLFPLLRDIIIADMNFHTPSFPFQLIANLPTDFGRLVQNYMQRNPQLLSDAVSDPHTESVVVDALAYAHAALIGKIEARKMKEGRTVDQRQPAVVTTDVEDFCETFERTVKPVVEEYAFTPRPISNEIGHKFSYPATQPSSTDPRAIHYHSRPQRALYSTAELTSSLPYGLDAQPQPAHHHQHQHRLLQHSHSLPSSPQKLHPHLPSAQSQLCVGNVYRSGSFADVPGCTVGEKITASRSKVLPKEAVALMTDWLREHRDNPYPNDDEKEALIATTRLTMNQINYWFTNARRRLLPKWALQRQIDEQHEIKLQQQDETASQETRVHTPAHLPCSDVIVI